MASRSVWFLPEDMLLFVLFDTWTKRSNRTIISHLPFTEPRIHHMTFSNPKSTNKNLLQSSTQLDFVWSLQFLHSSYLQHASCMIHYLRTTCFTEWMGSSGWNMGVLYKIPKYKQHTLMQWSEKERDRNEELYYKGLLGINVVRDIGVKEGKYFIWSDSKDVSLILKTNQYNRILFGCFSFEKHEAALWH